MKGRVLVVDDDDGMVSLISECLTLLEYDVQATSNSLNAMKLVADHRPGVCVLDYVMPNLTGGQLLEKIKALDSAIEVVFMTSEDSTRLAVEMMKNGAVDYLLKPVDLKRLELAVARAFDHHRLVIENEAYKANLERLVVDRTEALSNALGELQRLHGATLDAFAMALDFRDQGTSGHSRRVADLTAGVAAELGVTGTELVQIEQGALLHDVGKLKIPDSILWKPAKLTAEEYRAMKEHARYGYEFLQGIDFLKGAAEIVYCHHEKFDGSGYPRGLKGAEIPLGARLFSIVDAVDAMVYDRPYHKGVSFDDAAAEVHRCTGTQFDPEHAERVLNYLRIHLPKEKTGTRAEPGVVIR
jgi:putative nucleotidyltransferase with HDIG domain